MFKVIMTMFLSIHVFQASAMLQVLPVRKQTKMEQFHEKNLKELIHFFNSTVMVTAYGVVGDIVKQERGHLEEGRIQDGLRSWFSGYKAMGIPDATLWHHARQMVSVLREEEKLTLEQRIHWISFICDIMMQFNPAYSLTLKNDCLIFGAYRGNTNLVTWALQNGAQIETEYRPLLNDVRPGFRATALYWAQEKNHPATARYLVTQGATDPRVRQGEEASIEG